MSIIAVCVCYLKDFCRPHLVFVAFQELTISWAKALCYHSRYSVARGSKDRKSVTLPREGAECYRTNKVFPILECQPSCNISSVFIDAMEKAFEVGSYVKGEVVENYHFLAPVHFVELPSSFFVST